MSTLTTTVTSATAGETGGTEQTFQPSDFSFLSQLLHILQKVEAGEDPQEIATLASNLKTSFKKCQTILDHLPGADLSPNEQADILAEEMQVLEKKKYVLLDFYHDWTLLEIRRLHIDMCFPYIITYIERNWQATCPGRYSSMNQQRP